MTDVKLLLLSLHGSWYRGETVASSNTSSNEDVVILCFNPLWRYSVRKAAFDRDVSCAVSSGHCH